MPQWLHILAILSLVLAVLCAAIIAADIAAGRRQHMWIMNLVWPITALYAGPLALAAYFRVGRSDAHQAMHAMEHHGKTPPTQKKPFWQSIALAATHCGSGCTLGDLIAEGVVLSLVPLTLFDHRIFAAWAVDYVLAFAIGVAFQYFTIAPMQHLSPGKALVAALKADTLSLTAWQVGMYGWMAIVVFGIFGHELETGSPVFWFMMQIAMLAGFVTSYPVNWWLVRAGIKETM